MGGRTTTLSVRRFIAALSLLLAADQAEAQSARQRAQDLIERSLVAQGGAERLNAVGSIRVTSLGHEHALEQSERPEGPWLPTYRQTSELRDLRELRVRRTQEQRGFWQPEWHTTQLVADTGAVMMGIGERWIPAPSSLREDALEALALGPERILLTARSAPGLTYAGDTMVQGVGHHIVKFTWSDRGVSLYLNRHTLLPTGYAIPAAEGDVYAEVWGDATTMTLWSLWSLEDGGLLYPRQWDRERMGHSRSRDLLTTVEFAVPAPADSFHIGSEVRAAYSMVANRRLSTMRPGSGSSGSDASNKVASGIVSIPGSYATTFIAQDDGVIVLDAPMTGEWSNAVLAEAKSRFPDKPVKLVVSTSDAWLHIGGLREYAARGIPIVALDLNVPVIERLLASPHIRRPDSWEKGRRSVKLQSVAEPTTIGAGLNRIELYPVRGEGGERMMVVWLPELRILYASDLVQIRADGTAFWPQYLSEVAWVVQRHGLDPVTVFAMHTPPMPWSRLRELLEKHTSGARN